jgi:hypothetical protein
MPALLPSQPPHAPLGWLELVRQQVTSLQFGTVEIVVHDARVVQIDKTERLRLGHPEPDKGRRFAAGSPPAAVVAVSADSNP